jgi:hypothetical protein
MSKEVTDRERQMLAYIGDGRIVDAAHLHEIVVSLQNKGYVTICPNEFGSTFVRRDK